MKMDAVETKLNKLSSDWQEFKLQFSEKISKQEGVKVANFEIKSLNKGMDEYFRTGNSNALELKSLSSNDESAGVTILPELYKNISDNLEKRIAIRKLASIEHISTSALDVIIEEGDFNAGWAGENESRTATDNGNLKKLRIPVHELYAQPKATAKLLDDSEINIERWITDKLQDAFADIEHEAFIKGDGNNKPKGILTCSEIERSSSKKLSCDDLLMLIYGLEEKYHHNSAFLMHPSTLAFIRSLKDKSDRYILNTDSTSEFAGNIFGFPVYTSTAMPKFEDKGDLVIFGNFEKSYKIIDRKDISIMRDPYTEKPFVKFYAVKRVGGDVVAPKALKILNIAKS